MTAQQDGNSGGRCYLCGGARVVEDRETGDDKPCPVCRPAAEGGDGETD
jgi:hypothetical protein